MNKDKIDGVIAEIAQLAKIPASGRSRFHGYIFFHLILGAELVAGLKAATHAGAGDSAINTAERAVRSAYDAVRALNKTQRHVFEKAFYIAGSCRGLEFEEENIGGGLVVLEILVTAFASMTGRSPAFDPREATGRPKGTVANWQFQCIVGTLWQTVNMLGGDLSFSCKGNTGSGTMVNAIELLRTVLPTGLIPIKPAAKTIERIKASIYTKQYDGFDFVQSRRDRY